MTIFFLTFGILLLVITAMSVGVIFSSKPIKGSCGGMTALGMDTACDICGGDQEKCEKENEKLASTSESEFYDASKPDKKQD